MSKKCSLDISELSESDYVSVPPEVPQMDKFVCCLAISRLEEEERPSHTFQGLGVSPSLLARLRKKVKDFGRERAMKTGQVRETTSRPPSGDIFIHMI